MILRRGNTKRRRIGAVGMYDGVHLGHRFLLDYLRLEATQRGLASAAVTFSDHPLTIVRPDDVPPALSIPEEKYALLEDAGADDVIILKFDSAMRHLTARKFLEMLHKRWAIDALVVGFNNRFGRDRLEGIDQYREIGREIGIDVIEAPEYKGKGSPVSSSIVRQLLADGKLEEANTALGRFYDLTGTVVDGRRLGRTLGFPTANVAPETANAALPKFGVYAAVAVTPDGEEHPAVVNIGRRPTVEENAETAPVTIEAHLIGYAGYLYGSRLTLRFVERLRDEKKFSGIDKLRKALEGDCRKAVGILKRRGLLSADD